MSSLYHVNLNCSDYGRSLAFYRQLGFQVIHEFAVGGDPQTRPMLGLALDRRSRSCLMSLEPDNPAATALDLVEWSNPPGAKGASPDMTATGLRRLAIRVDDIHGTYARLNAQGIEFLTPPGQSTRGTWLCCCLDPDGVFVQLTQPA